LCAEDDAEKLVSSIPADTTTLQAAIGAEKQGLSKLANKLMRACHESDALAFAQELSEGDKAHFVACAPVNWVLSKMVNDDVIKVLKAKSTRNESGYKSIHALLAYQQYASFGRPYI
jgi:hypothetical protein